MGIVAVWASGKMGLPEAIFLLVYNKAVVSLWNLLESDSIGVFFGGRFLKAF